MSKHRIRHGIPRDLRRLIDKIARQGAEKFGRLYKDTDYSVTERLWPNGKTN